MENTEKEPKAPKVQKKKSRVKKGSGIKSQASAPAKNLIMIGSLSIIFSILAGAAFLMLTSALETEVFYVLNRDVQANELITPDMLAPQETAAGGTPINAMGVAEIQMGGVHARFPLAAGDVVSRSNTTSQLDWTLGVPDDWAITSFNINADHALGGRLQRGDFVDMLVIQSDGNIFEFDGATDSITNNDGDGNRLHENVAQGRTGEAQFVFTSMMVLEVSGGHNEVVHTEDGGAIAQTTLGEELQFLVALPPEEVAMLHSALERFSSVRLIRSPFMIHYAERNLDSLNNVFLFNSTNLPVADMFEGADPTFVQILRDNTGRPVTHQACASNLITPVELCMELPEVEENVVDVLEENNDINTYE